MDHSFLDGVDAQKGRWRDNAAEAKGISTRYYWLGRGRDALEVAYGMAEARPNATTVREVWKQRHGRAAAPLLVVVGYPTSLPRRAVVCGPAGEDPPVVDLDHTHAERLAAAALAEPDRHVAIRFLASALEGDPGEQPGLRNKGLLATHELLHGVPERGDWRGATERSEPLLGLRGQDLVRGLGYEIEPRGQHSVLRAAEGQAQAVAVFLEEDEQPDQTSARFENQTPATYALTHAERDRLPWVVAVRGGVIRLYSTATSGAAGQRGRTETFVELNLPLLPSERAGYLHLLFSAEALADGGSIEEIRQASSDYTSQLSERLRERIYKEVVPRLAVAVADQVGGTDEDDLERHYRPWAWIEIVQDCDTLRDAHTLGRGLRGHHPSERRSCKYTLDFHRKFITSIKMLGSNAEGKKGCLEFTKSQSLDGYRSRLNPCPGTDCSNRVAANWWH